MKTTWTVLLCAFMSVSLLATAQDNGSSNDQNRPVLQQRPDQGNTAPAQQSPGASQPASGSSQINGAPPNAIPEGSRFIIKLKDTLDTRKMDYNQGKHFKAELRDDLVTPSGLLIPKGRTIKGHVASFERGYTGARIMLALDEIETRHGWVPLIGRVTGVPGDPSVRSTENEGEISRKGPDKKRVITNAAIGAGVGAATGAAVGGGKGAAIGAAVGAGVGGGTGLLFAGSDIKLDKNSQLEVRLDRDLVVPTESR